MLRLIYWKTTVVTVFLAFYPEGFNKFYASYEATQTYTLYVPGDLWKPHGELKIQSTPDNSNLQGKSKKGSSYQEFELSGSEENSRE